MDHQVHPRDQDDEDEDEDGSFLEALLSLCCMGLWVQGDTASRKRIANGRSNPKTVQGDGYQWDPSTNVLLIQSWDRVFGRPPLQEKRHFEDSDYLRFMEKMQRKLADILLRIISTSATSRRKGRGQVHSNTSSLLSRIRIVIAVWEDPKNIQLFNDFREFIKTFTLFTEDTPGANQRYSLSNRGRPVVVGRDSISQFKARAQVKVEGWIRECPNLRTETKSWLREQDFEPSAIIPGNVFMELWRNELVPRNLSIHIHHTWSEVIDGRNHSFQVERPSPETLPNTEAWKIKEWLKHHNLTSETAEAIWNAKGHPNALIPHNVFQDLQKHHVLKESIHEEKNMTWADLAHMIHATVDESL